jgi:glycosyltransferase involved in cell wall biosynthesis
MNVCYFGAFDPQYPRNQIIRAGLAAHGVNVQTVNVDRRLSTRRKLAPLLRAYRQAARATRFDAFIVPEFNHTLVPLAWVLARRRRIPLIFDGLVSMYDAVVIDRGQTRRGAWRAGVLYRLDWLAMRLASAVLVDTRQHKAYLSDLLRLSPERLHVVPVGAYEDWFYPRPVRRLDDSLRVQYFGTYIPFHGVEHILEAAALLRDRTDITFQLIGGGQTYAAMRAHAERLALGNVVFIDAVPPPELPARISESDITLGVFGAAEKTGRVVPNKVYQNLAMCKPLITADSAAVRDTFTGGEHLRMVPPADPGALAQAILELAGDGDERERLAAGGYARMGEAFTTQHVGAGVLAILEMLTS